jgi:RNA polymerase sigma factor (sigma-70 family)
VIINQHINLWRRYRLRELVTQSPPDRVTNDPAEGVANRDALRVALRSLAPRTRAVVVLRYVVDLPEVEVAAALGCSVGTVKSQASRGLARLRVALDPVALSTTLR